MKNIRNQKGFTLCPFSCSADYPYNESLAMSSPGDDANEHLNEMQLGGSRYESKR